MRKILKLLGFLLLAFVLICGFSFLTNKAKYNVWTIKNDATDSANIAWAPFQWGGDWFGNKYMGRAAMQIPVKIDGFPYAYRFQFDLGASLTEVYEKNFQSLFATAPELKTKVERLHGQLQFWDSRLSVENLAFRMGNLVATNKHCYLHRNYGEPLEIANASDTSRLQLGTIGADMFQGKALIIDYPGQRFAICDAVPPAFKTNFVDIELDGLGRVVLPMRFRGRTYRVMFDNGSSIFPLITQAAHITKFANGADTDTLQISSWGQLHNVTGKLIADTLELGGRTFSSVKIYANHSGYGIDKATDAMAGNALFWNNAVIIDFKNKKFGVK